MYTDNILACYMQSLNSEVANGKLWYADAKQAAQDMADKYELPLHVVVGVIAALSPTNMWKAASLVPTKQCVIRLGLFCSLCPMIMMMWRLYSKAQR